MKNINNISSLSDLLKNLKSLATPIFINLGSRIGNESFLIDQSIARIQESYGRELVYQKLENTPSQIIKQELKTTKNPVLLLVKKGEIKAILSGMIAQHQLEEALDNLNFNSH